MEENELSLQKVLCAKNPADMLTKSVSRDKLRLCKTLVGLR